MDDDIRAELAVQELLLRVLLAELRQTNPAAVASAAAALASVKLRRETPEGAAVLQKWTALLKP